MCSINKGAAKTFVFFVVNKRDEWLYAANGHVKLLDYVKPLNWPFFTTRTYQPTVRGRSVCWKTSRTRQARTRRLARSRVSKSDGTPDMGQTMTQVAQEAGLQKGSCR